ncbi:hypothetical protein [Confluentibacter sediminis]|uniref:hypothetical protein n=1 Tax=Confluentibacter sediminis TaxID=2219045 RepID=UPI000DAE396E|nr:hypothetical protein [Confluentibacter sediminis]
MVKHYLFLLFILSYNLFFAQNSCEGANSDLIYAYSHVKSSYNSNNISHLKYYANRSLEAFERSKKKLKECGCETAYDLAYDAAQLLSKVESAESFEDGRFFVKRARDIAQQSVTELDRCTISTKEIQINADNQELSSLQMEQEKLKQQQEELKRKSEEIKIKMAEQNAMALKLKKQEMINSYKSAISSNIESYNNALKACNCDKNLITLEDKNMDVSEKSEAEIKRYYLNSLKSLNSNYLYQLNLCDDN